MAITTTTSLPAPVQQTFDMKLLSVPVPNMIHNLFATKKRLPAHGGTTLRMRRYNPLQTALVPLGDTGVNPPSQNLTAVDIDAKVSWYGTYVILNEQVTLQNQDPVLNQAVERLGVSLRQTEDTLTRDMLAATAGFINCINGTNGDNPTNITDLDVSNVISALLGNDAYMIEDNIIGENRFGTGPVRAAYWAMCHTNLTPSLEQVNSFIPQASYPNPMKALNSEWGAIRNCRFVVSSIGSISQNASNLGNNVYNIFITALDAYANIDQDGAYARFIYRGPEFDGPMMLNSSAGWKTAFVPRITNDLWLINLRATIIG